VEDVVRHSMRLSGRVKLRAARTVAPGVANAAQRLADCLQAGGRGYIAGNGGSAADAQHFAAEFTGRFRSDREPLPVISLTTDTSALTAIGNDYGFEQIFARPVLALGRPGDVLLALSTSGNSDNVIAACRAAHERGMTVVGITGATGGLLASHSDVLIKIPSGVTARIQESTMAVLHSVCDVVEQILGVSGDPVGDITDVQLDVRQLAASRESWRGQALTVVSTNGCFDVLHAGHLSSLEGAAALGDVLVVLVNSDESVRRLKGEGRPVNTERDRVAMLGSLLPVDNVVVFSEDTPTEVLDVLQPTVHCKGEEYRDSPLPEEAVVRAHGGRVEFLPRVPGLSTTAVVGPSELSSGAVDV